MQFLKKRSSLVVKNGLTIHGVDFCWSRERNCSWGEVETERTWSGRVRTCLDCFDPSFFERGVPSAPTRRRPTRFIHFPVTAFSTFVDVGVNVRVSPFEVESAVVFLLDDIVGVMKFPLAVSSEWAGVFFGVWEGERSLRRFLLAASEVISTRVPMVELTSSERSVTHVWQREGWTRQKPMGKAPSERAWEGVYNCWKLWSKKVKVRTGNSREGDVNKQQLLDWWSTSPVYVDVLNYSRFTAVLQHILTPRSDCTLTLTKIPWVHFSHKPLQRASANSHQSCRNCPTCHDLDLSTRITSDHVEMSTDEVGTVFPGWQWTHS